MNESQTVKQLSRSSERKTIKREMQKRIETNQTIMTVVRDLVQNCRSKVSIEERDRSKNCVNSNKIYWVSNQKKKKKEIDKDK